jgi:hypothetical protein
MRSPNITHISIFPGAAMPRACSSKWNSSSNLRCSLMVGASSHTGSSLPRVRLPDLGEIRQGCRI